MEKKKLGSKSVLYPYPVTVVGAEVDGKPNFVTIGFIGIVNANPGMIAMGINKEHYTPQGILGIETFSVNLPSKNMLEAVDYVGLNSGEEVDKSELFEVFYGELDTAPMIEECPLNIECEVREVLDLGGADHIIIGEIVESYVDEEYLTDGNPDLEKMKPVVFSMYENKYFGIGEYLGPGWELGKNFKK